MVTGAMPGVRVADPALQPTTINVPGPCALPAGMQSSIGISFTILRLFGSITASPPWFFSSFHTGTEA